VTHIGHVLPLHIGVTKCPTQACTIPEFNPRSRECQYASSSPVIMLRGWISLQAYSKAHPVQCCPINLHQCSGPHRFPHQRQHSGSHQFLQGFLIGLAHKTYPHARPLAQGFSLMDFLLLFLQISFFCIMSPHISDAAARVCRSPGRYRGQTDHCYLAPIHANKT